MKVVINIKPDGVFDLSEEAIVRFFKRKRKTLNVYKFGWLTRYITCSVDKYATLEKKSYINGDNKHLKYEVDFSKIERHDDDLVYVVNDLCQYANTPFCKLRIVEIPDNIEWEIVKDSDGKEFIVEVGRTWR